MLPDMIGSSCALGQSFGMCVWTVAAAVPLEVTFQHQVRLAVGETVALHLPSFGSPLSSVSGGPGLSVTGPGSMSRISQVTWARDTSTLTLVVGATILAMEKVNVTIPLTAGFRLPATGIDETGRIGGTTGDEGGSFLTVTTNAAAGPTPAAQRLTQSPYVGGSFSSTRLAYDPVTPGAAAAVTVTFALDGTIAEGEINP